jgi:hypothetical protein
MTTIEHPRSHAHPHAVTTASRPRITRLFPRRRALVPGHAREIRARGAISIRRGTAHDAEQLDRLVQLTERPQPASPLLVAEVDGEIVAATSLDDAAELRNPFRVTSDLVALLRLRAEQLRAAGP